MKIGQLSQKAYKINFWAFIWHAALLAMSKSFIDTDSILSAMLVNAGGNELLLGLMTSIIIGGGKFFQLFFASYISPKIRKKNHILIAINIRILMIFTLAILIAHYNQISKTCFFSLFFLLIFIFTISGAYGGVAYTDILGKSIKKEQRLKLFSLKQVVQAFGFVISAFIVKFILKKYSFPNNYYHLFLYATIILFLGSLGFWLIHEKIVIPKAKKTLWQFFALIPKEIHENKNLLNYLLIINTLNIAIVFTPFLISYLKTNSELTGNIIGNILLIKMFGTVFGSLFVYFKKSIKYKTLLIIAAVLSALLPIWALWTINNLFYYSLLFVISGIIFSLIRIANEGILIEISNDKNRSEYAGIVGAANISSIIFPVFIGGIITSVGYTASFLFVMLLIGSSLYFIHKLKC